MCRSTTHILISHLTIIQAAAENLTSPRQLHQASPDHHPCPPRNHPNPHLYGYWFSPCPCSFTRVLKLSMDYPCLFLTFLYVSSYSRSIFLVCILKMHSYWGFPGSPVFKTPCSQSRLHGINLWSGNSGPPCCISSVAQSCPTLCDPMNRNTLGLPVHHQLPEFTQTSVHRFGDAIQPSHPLSSPSPPAPNPSQHQSLFQWVNSSHEVAKVLEFQL